MRVFVAGATGYVGSAVVRELRAGGHDVLGLARSEEAAGALAAAGVAVHRGSIADPDSLRAGAAAADAVVYAANEHITETRDRVARAAAELAAVEAIGSALVDTGKAFAVTSGTHGRTPGTVFTEETPDVPDSPAGLRLPVERSVLALAGRGVRSSAVRLSAAVHGDGDTRGFIPTLVGIARATGVSAYVGDGAARWTAVHHRDAATLFRLAVESAPPGSACHAVAESVPFRDIAGAIGRLLDLPVASVEPGRAAAHFGFLAPLVTLDCPASSELTRRRLGWKAAQHGVLDDIAAGHYLMTPAS